MKIKVLADCKWAQEPSEPQLTFKANEEVEVSEKLGGRMIESGFAVLAKEHQEENLQEKMLDVKPENKMLNPEYKNKSADKKNKG